MTVLPKRKIGKTRLEVTTLGLGGAPLGGFRATIPDTEAAALVETAWQDGVRYYDTSPFYGYGRSELRMGAGLREKPRGEYVLSTKIGRILHPLKPGEKKPADFPTTACPASRRSSTTPTTASCARSSTRISGSGSPRSTSR